jgi:hypothetical protein
MPDACLPARGHDTYLGLSILGCIANDDLMVAMAVGALGNRRLSRAAGWASCCSLQCTSKAANRLERSPCKRSMAHGMEDLPMLTLPEHGP